MPIERFVALQWIAIATVFAWLIYLLEPILTPFVAAAILAYICNPVVGWLSKLNLPQGRHMPRTVAVILVILSLMALLTLLVLIMLPLLQREFNHFMSRLPVFLDTARFKILPFLQQQLGMELQWDNEVLKDLLASNWQSAGGAAAKVLPWLGGSSAMLLSLLMNVLLIPLVLFYLLRDWSLVMGKIETLVPRHMHGKVMEIATEVNNILAEFLHGQISVMLLMSTYYATALWLCGLQFALPIGVVAGMLVFVPYLGMFTGLTLATLAAVTQFDHFGSILLVWGAFGAGQLLEGMLITPWLVGDRIGLHPLAVIFALLAFGQLFGFFGLLLALPLSAVLLVALRHTGRWYMNSSLYKK